MSKLIISNDYGLDDDRIIFWDAARNPTIMFLKLLGIRDGINSFDDVQFENFTFNSVTNLAVEPCGLGVNGKPVTKIMANMCSHKELRPLLATILEKATRGIGPGEAKLFCTFSKKDRSYKFNFYLLTCEKKYFKNDYTLRYAGREGWLSSSFVQDVFILYKFFDRE